MSNSDWYARRLRQGHQAAPAAPAAPPPHTPIAPPGAWAPQPPAAPAPGYQPASAPAPVPVAQLCPNCRSQNWMRPNQNAAERCFDCGHVAGRDWGLSADGAVMSGAPTTATKQVPTQGYQPNVIVGKA